MKKLALSIFLILILTQCQRNDNYKSDANMESIMVAEPSIDGDKLANKKMAHASEKINRQMLIKNAQIDFETKQMDQSGIFIMSLIRKYNAYVSADVEHNYSQRKERNLELRIPAQNFENFMKEMTDSIKDIDAFNLDTQDVTEEYLDVNTRIKNKEALEQTYIKLLNKAKTIKEILEIQAKISDIRTDIERMQGRIKYLSNRVSYATLKISFYQVKHIETKKPNRFVSGIKNGWSLLVNFMLVLVNIWPFLLLISLGIFIYKRKRKK